MYRYVAFECVVKPYGLKSTLVHFQQSTNLLLADLLDKCVLMYIDNILIYSKTTEEHITHVKAVFEPLATKNWHVKEKNYALLLPEVEFLGYVVSAVGIKVAVDKVDAVALWSTPTCVPKVQGLLVLANFYRRFVKGFTGWTLESRLSGFLCGQCGSCDHRWVRSFSDPIGPGAGDN